MTLYHYKVRNKIGKMIEGEQVSEGVEQLAFKLQQDNLLILEINKIRNQKQLGESIFHSFFIDRIRLTELALFCRQLTFMLEAGLTLSLALQVIVENEAQSSIKKMAKALLKELKSGFSFSEACARYSQKLPPMLIDMVAAAEIGGFLANSLERVANYFEKEIELKEKIKTAMLYPTLVFFIATLAIMIIFTYVIPVFANILQDMDAPIPFNTQIILTTSIIFQEYWYFIIAGIISTVTFMIIYGRSSQGKIALNSIVLKIPLINDFFQKAIVARFCRTLANLLHSGVPLLKALNVVERTIENDTLKKEIIKAQKLLKEGKSLAESFRGGIFPPMVIQMMAVGEKSGNLDQILLKISEYYDRDISEATERLPKLIEPIMIVFLGIVVGTVVLGVILPMFTVMSSIGA